MGSRREVNHQMGFVPEGSDNVHDRGGLAAPRIPWVSAKTSLCLGHDVTRLSASHECSVPNLLRAIKMAMPFDPEILFLGNNLPDRIEKGPKSRAERC